MKRTIAQLAFYLCLTIAVARGQTNTHPFEVPTDPRSVAMGESFSGLPSNQAALMYNPAGLVGMTGIRASYSQRNLNWFSDEIYFYGVQASVAVPFGVFAAHYNRFSLGSFHVTTPASPFPSEQEISPYEHDIALGFGMPVVKGLSAGVEAKYFDSQISLAGYSTTPAWLFDAGVLYSFEPFHDQDVWQDCVSLGLSVQNIGTKLKTHAPASIYYSTEVAEALPQYLRLGLGYTFALYPPQDGGLTPLRGAVTGEFRSWLNPDLSSQQNFWGCGAEMSFYDILTFRGGWVWYPFSSIYNTEGSASRFRYGAGITLPLQQLGFSVPILCSANYSAIPIQDLNFYFASPQRLMLDTFSFEVNYTGGLW